MRDEFKDVKVGDKLVASYSTDWANPHLTIITVTKVYKLYFVASFANGNIIEYNFHGDIRGGSRDTWSTARRQTLIQWTQEIHDKVREVHGRKVIAKKFTKYVNELKLEELPLSTLLELSAAVESVELKPLVTENDTKVG